jgi:hypothetical protein
MRGVNEADDEGRAGEEVGIKRGVELRCEGGERAPRWEDILNVVYKVKIRSIFVAKVGR